MDAKKLLKAAAAFTVISFAIYMAGAVLLDMPYYTDAANASLWSPAMMPAADSAPPLSYFLLSIASTFLMGVLLSFLYFASRNAFNSNKPFKNDKALVVGAKFGAFIFLLMPLSTFFFIYSTFAIPMALNFSWLLQGLAASVLGGMAIGKLMQ